MLENLSVNWWGALVAIVVVTVLAGLWFTVVVGTAYDTAVGRPADAPAPSGALFIVGPLICTIATVLASALLVGALDLETLGDGLVFGTIIGLGYLVPMTFQIAINPVFARPLSYGLVNGPYFLLAGLVTGVSLTVV